MRTLLRHLNRAKQRWKKIVRTPNALAEDQSLRKKQLMDVLERQRLRQRLNLAAVQQVLNERNTDLVQKRDSLQSYMEDAMLQASYDQNNSILLQRKLTSGNIIENDKFENILNAKKQKLRNDLLEKKELLKEAMDDIHDKTDALNVELNKRKARLKETLHNQTEKIQETIGSHREDLRKAVRIRRKSIQDAVAARKAKFLKTEERIKERGKLIIRDIHETKEKMKEAVENVVEKENIYTIPNLLCVTRIAFSPYLAYLIVSHNFEYALGFMVVASFSDFLDGWIARNFKNQSTKIGSFIDPMADKVLIGTLFLTLTYVDLIPVPLTVLIVARDVMLVAAGFVIRYMSLPPPRTLSRYFDATHATAQLAPTLISKINTGVQLVLVGSTLAAPVFGYIDHPALVGLCYVTAVTTVVSAASYLISKDTYRFLRNKQ